MDDLDAYRKMLERSDLSELNGVLRMLDREKFPQRFAVAQEVYRKKAAEEMPDSEGDAEPKPKGRISRNWHWINAVIVGLLSIHACYSSYAIADSRIYFFWKEIFFAIVGVAGVTLYFWKYSVGHYLILAWWIPQLISWTHEKIEYGLTSGFTLGLEFQFGPIEIKLNILAAVSIFMLATYRSFYSKQILPVD